MKGGIRGGDGKAVIILICGIGGGGGFDILLIGACIGRKF